MFPNGKSTLNSLKFLVILGQCFALLPLSGITSQNVSKLKLKWISLRMIYFAFWSSGTFFMVSMGFYHIMVYESLFRHIVEHVFYLSTFINLILFLNLAREWPMLMVEWTKVDVIMGGKYGYPKNLDRMLHWISAIWMSLAFGEYISSLAFHYSKTGNNLMQGADWQVYFTTVFPQIFTHIPYSIWIAIFVRSVSVCSTFIWNYNNLFIVVISSCLAVRFRQIGLRLKSQEKLFNSVKYWREMREDYVRLCNLCQLLDKLINKMILFSYATNLFFILVQLYHTLRPIHNPMEKIYFYFSFGFLIFRTVTVSLFAAWINDESKSPTVVLNSVPSKLYNKEVKLFLMHISFDSAVLTGSKMFKVSRGLILNIAGAIVSYELVLIQLNGSNLEISLQDWRAAKNFSY